MIWIFLAFTIAIVRIIMPAHGIQSQDIFKDIAHLYVGGLFGAWFATKKKCYRDVALALTALEVIAFLIKS